MGLLFSYLPLSMPQATLAMKATPGLCKQEGVFMFIGTLLLVIGALMLLEKLGIIYGSAWDYIIPVALIALGADFIINHRKKIR